VAVRGSLVILRSVEYVVNNYVTLSGIVLHALTDEKLLNLEIIVFVVGCSFEKVIYVIKLLENKKLKHGAK
jgi:hypothetical protein